jgi:malate synthase
MTAYVDRAGLRVAETLAAFIEDEALPQSGVDSSNFWHGVADLFTAFAPENAQLLEERDRLQFEIDAWLRTHPQPFDAAEHETMLRDIGYLAPEPEPFNIDVRNVDAELATTAAPQLVVPVLNARFLLNAANARWGSLYDALYGTDVIDVAVKTEAYDYARGTAVITFAKKFLDRTIPLASGKHEEATGYRINEGQLAPELANPAAFVGFRGSAEAPSAILFCHHGLHIELQLDPSHPIGAQDAAGVSDVVLEAAVSSIVDLEDSIAAVDAEDKVFAYRRWLGVMKGDLEAPFSKDGRALTRRLAEDRAYTTADGGILTLSGRSLLLVRNVGLHMMTSALRMPNGADAPEGILDAIVTCLIGLHDLCGNGRFTNSRAGSIYVVKPKLHGPNEAAFCDRLFDAVEDLLGAPRHTVKVGLMDEERRTSANLAACIKALRHRIMFINTGFLDRTGDEIHTAKGTGPVCRKSDMKTSPWLVAYESRNVLIGLSCGFPGRAQIGKGMWAIPAQMNAMLQDKIAHPRAGASTAWVPSPTAATLHALHYHEIDVFARQRELIRDETPSLQQLLTPPIANRATLSTFGIREEIDNNVQGMLGYVVRWVDQGMGCSTIPDIHDVGLMEDRATLRVSSQLLANWLEHGVCSLNDIDAALARLMPIVDAQNANDPEYAPMAGDGQNLAFRAARALIVDGVRQPNGYTEAILHKFRQLKKTRA